MKYKFLMAIGFISLMYACNQSKNNPEYETDLSQPKRSKAEVQKELIENYVKANNLKGAFTPSGMYVVTMEPGKDGHPSITDEVEMEYQGYLLDGTKFDGTEPGKTIKFNLAQLIKGWQEGIPMFGKGGVGKLIIPSDMGYGDQASGKIPAQSVLVFDIKLFGWKTPDSKSKNQELTIDPSQMR